VDGRAHQRPAHRSPLCDQVGQLVGPEAVKPGPEREVRNVGRLSLHTDEPLDRLGGGQSSTPQQDLPLQQGAVERSGSEDVARPAFSPRWHCGRLTPRRYIGPAR
jgi:hypothetical protein